jgi:hypothetical protein
LWAEWALSAALITVVLATIVTLIGVPASLAKSRLLGFGPAVDTNKAWLLTVWACGVIAVLTTVLLDRLSRRGRLSTVWQHSVSVMALVGVGVLGVFTAWRNGEYANTAQWNGFSFSSLGLGGLAAIVALALLMKRMGTGRQLLTISVVVVACLASFPLLQLQVDWNGEFTLEELLAPASGRLPGFDYVSQYESLLGLPLAAIAWATPAFFARHASLFAFVWVIFLQIATIGLAVVTAIWVAPRRLRWLMPVLVVPVIFLQGRVGLGYYASLPLRFVLPTVLLAAIAFIGMRRIGRRERWWVPFVLGSIAGITAFNNLDFGVPALLSGLIVVFVAQRGFLRGLRAAAIYLGGAITPVAAYLIITSLAGHQFHPSYYLFFVHAFAVTGISNMPLPVLGLHIAFVMLAIIGLVIGFLGTRRLTLRNSVLHQALLYESSWLLLSLIYFSGRAVTPNLVIGSSFQAAVILALLFCAGFSNLRLLRRTGVTTWRNGEWIAAALTVLALAIPFASWTYFPSIKESGEAVVSQIKPSKTIPSFLLPDPTGALASVPNTANLMGILGISGSTWSPRLGITNANLFLNPIYLDLPGAADMQCEYLQSLPGSQLMLTRTSLTMLSGSALCRDVLDVNSGRDLAKAHTTDLSPAVVQWVLVDRR